MGQQVWDCIQPTLSCLLALVADFVLSLKNGLYGKIHVFCLASVVLLNVIYFFKQKHSGFVIGLRAALLDLFMLASQISSLVANLPVLCKEMQLFAIASKHKILYLLLIHLFML